MNEQYERLKEARIAAGYGRAVDAALAMGVKLSTYTHHENGTAGLSRVGQRYARFFGVSFEWLMTGRGAMKDKADAEWSIPIDGLVGAGASVEMMSDTAAFDAPTEVALDLGVLKGLLVRGESQWPRFMDGEIILYDPRPINPSELIGRYAVVQDLEGRRLIKLLRRGSREGTWTLESHNAPPEHNVRLIAAWRYVGVIEK